MVTTGRSKPKNRGFRAGKLSGRTMLTKGSSTLGTLLRTCLAPARAAAQRTTGGYLVAGVVLYECSRGDAHSSGIRETLSCTHPHFRTGDHTAPRSGISEGARADCSECLNEGAGERYQHVDETGRRPNGLSGHRWPKESPTARRTDVIRGNGGLFRMPGRVLLWWSRFGCIAVNERKDDRTGPARNQVGRRLPPRNLSRRCRVTNRCRRDPRRLINKSWEKINPSAQ